MFWAQLTKKCMHFQETGGGGGNKKKWESYVYYIHQTAPNFSDLFKRMQSWMKTLSSIFTVSCVFHENK